jgi:hypothetical protein
MARQEKRRWGNGRLGEGRVDRGILCGCPARVGDGDGDGDWDWDWDLGGGGKRGGG